MNVKVIALLTLMALCVNTCNSSAIPMWEYLTRDEKMSHLYSMFAKQVQTYCKSKTSGDSAQCKKNMMLYGVSKLNEMEESHLDQMDPYQRNANIILWDSMMDGHVDAKDERQQYLQREQYQQQNPLFRAEVTTGNEETYELGSTDQYDDDEHNNYLHQGDATNYNYAYINKPNDLDNQEYLEQNTNYLMGSMVSYMMPDGSPVKDNNFNIIPQDDDREDMTTGSRRMPTMQQLYASIRTMDEEPKVIMELPPQTTTAAAPSDDATAPSPRTIRTLYGTYRLH